MSEQTAQRIIDGESGYRRDLREAELQIVAADNDPVALAKAFNRHAEAVRNMMIAEIIPSFERVLAPLLDDKLTPVVSGIGGLQAGVTRLNTHFQAISAIVEQLVTDMSDSKQDRVHLNDKVDKLQHAFDRLQAEFANYRQGSKRDAIALMQQQIGELQGNYTVEERTRLTTVLLAMIKDYEATHTQL